MKVILIVLLTALSIVKNVKGQDATIIESQFQGGDQALADFLQKSFSKELKGGLPELCLISVTFARFNIDTSGKVANLVFSENEGTPLLLRKILEKVIMSTNGLWVPKKINNVATESKPYVLPLIYQLEAGCYIKKKHIDNGTDNALLSFYNGPNGFNVDKPQLDCILLKPLLMFSAN